MEYATAATFLALGLFFAFIVIERNRNSKPRAIGFEQLPTSFVDRKYLLDSACEQYFSRGNRTRVKYDSKNNTDLVDAVGYRITRKIISFDIAHRLMYCFLPKAGTTDALSNMVDLQCGVFLYFLLMFIVPIGAH